MPEQQGFLIACGGTGGHLFPGIAVGEELRRRGHEVIFVISEKEIDRVASGAYQHLRFERMPSMAMPKPYSPAMLKFVSTSSKAYRFCTRWMREIDARAVLGMGGFTSAVPLFAAKATGRPGFIHESNAVPGRANLLNAKFAKRVLVGWEDCADRFPGAQVDVVGTPVRPDFQVAVTPEEAREHFGLDPSRQTLLVMGGSQGARGINELAGGMLETLEAAGIQVLHIAGPKEVESVRAGYEGRQLPSEVMDFCSEMDRAYAAADLAICRSGASSLNEMAVVGLPGILIPYPFAADDHQTKNAMVFVRNEACLMTQEKETDAEKLGRMVVDLASHPERLAAMRDQMLALAPTDAAVRIADLMEAEGR